MIDITKSIEDLIQAKDANSAFSVFVKAMEEFGYDRVSYTLCTDHPSLGLSKQHGLSTSYPDDWMSHYIENSFLKTDPVVNQLLKSKLPFYWDHLIANLDKDSKPYNLMKDAEDAGVGDGIGISFRTPYDEITGIGIARSKRLSKNQSYDDMAKIYFITSYFHETYRSLITPQFDVKLNSKQLDILSWAAEGKTDSEIAELMNLNFNTIRYHWNKIFEELSTFNKVHAVSKALRLKIITPGLITY